MAPGARVVTTRVVNRVAHFFPIWVQCALETGVVFLRWAWAPVGFGSIAPETVEFRGFVDRFATFRAKVVAHISDDFANCRAYI
jgi:hypothetical protein